MGSSYIKRSGLFKKLLIQDQEIISNISEDEINKQFDYKYHTKNIDTILKGFLKINMTKLNILYEGKAKILYETNVANELIQFLKMMQQPTMHKN